MNVAILNGSKPGDECSEKILEILSNVFQANQWESTRFNLAEMKITHCRGCFGCWVQKPGICLLEDDAQALAPAVIGSDLAVFFTPVTFGGFSADLKKGLDRLIGLVSPFFMKIAGETHHRPRYDSYPALLAVGIQPAADPDSAKTFSTLVERNAINFHFPDFATRIITAEQDENEIRNGFAATLDAMGGNK